MSGHSFDKHIDINSIPTLPAIAMEAIRLMEGEQSNFDSIADLLKNDQVLSGRILHYANSAYVGSRSEITTISRAISQLGFNTVRSIILSASVFDCFSKKTDNRQELVNFWLHSIGVAATAEILAAKLGFDVPEEAYLAGLVHDIGKLVCFLYMPEEFGLVCQKLSDQGGYSTESPNSLEIENEIMGISHTEVGKIIANQWLFPEALAKVMWLHHQPVYETILPDDNNLHQIVRFADVLCVSHNIGSSYFLSKNAYDHQHFHFSLENLMMHHHLDNAELDKIIKEVVVRVKEVSNVLGINDEDQYLSLVSSANVSLGNMSINLERKNKELASANRVLDATYNMTRRLKSGMSINDAVQEIILASREAFNVSRCLCMVLDKGNEQFLGQVYDSESFEEFVVPVNLKRYKNAGRSENSDIQYEAVKRLSEANRDFRMGSIMESGIAEIISGSEFMASFFVADKKSHGRPERIVGELMVDFRGSDGFESMEEISRNFQVLATAAANSIERIILEKDLNLQAKKMAEASRKMEESQRQLFHSHRLATVGRLAAGAAHEINNPLTIISLNLQIMERMLADSQDLELKKRLNVISDQERRISKIIGELMGFARPTQPKLGEANVYDMVNSVLEVIGDRVPMKKINLRNEIAKDLPMVMVDEGQIEQVIMNLLINANHSMPDGGDLTLKARREDQSRVLISITDTGTGISPENLGKIFDPFFTTKKEGEGTGLGLAICNSIVEHNGGALSVSSKVGKGTTFTVRLPVDKGTRLRALKKAVDQKERPSPVEEASRILIVDDERLLNNMLQECLRSAGYEVDGAYDGIEGIGLLRYKKYHLILLDIRMPRKDGFDVLKFVKDEYPDIPVIIITGLASMEEIKDTVKMGAFACLKKPFLLENVIKKVGEALKSNERKS